MFYLKKLDETFNTDSVSELKKNRTKAGKLGGVEAISEAIENNVKNFEICKLSFRSLYETTLVNGKHNKKLTRS